MPFVIGEQIGPYRLVEQLGQGGMATVFKAYHAALDRYVAIKVLHVAFMEDPNFLARFRREARVVARLDHPNIIPIYDFAEHEGRPYLVMKFIEGETLKARLEKGALPPNEILRIVERMGDALAYAHRLDVLHRDIKPSNVMIARDGQLYLTDFGLARMAQTGESSLTADRMVGTPQYMSPEQALSKPNLDARSDIYSFGVMMYEMLVGRVPYNADTPFAIIHDHIYTPLPMPRQVNPNLSESVERVLLKALAKEPGDRFADITSLVKAYQSAVSALPTLQVPQSTPKEPAIAPPPSVVEQKPSQKTETATETAKTGAQVAVAGGRKRASNIPWIIALLVIGGIGLLVCGFLGMRLVRNRMAWVATSKVPASSTVTPLAVRTQAVAEEKATSQPPPAGEGVTAPPERPVEDAMGLIKEAAMAWESDHTGAASDLLAAARKAADDKPGFYVDAVQYLCDRNDWLLAAMLIFDDRPLPEDFQGPKELAERTHEVIYMAARDPRAGDFFARHQRMPIMAVGAARYTLYFGKMEEAKNALDRFHRNPVQMERFPEIRLLEVEFFIQAKDFQPARDLIHGLMKDAPILPPWINRQAQELNKILNP